ncbi:transmembrane protein 244 isoform X2 [Scyliorhinus canicula]|uniref:transmembrane protein 244 isoform X2 n=1 Tax=Scyliorhinus canicula TaxID=7830 RepID=UPI0018F50C69|nr:transmembrane protein 244 isoform X2 [Scyliorhinus canicula]
MKILDGLETYDALIPFDFKTGASFASSKYIVNLVSMEMTYFVSGLLFAGVVKDWVWDYAITVTLIHIAVTSTVMAEFPLVWHWWLALETKMADAVDTAEDALTVLEAAQVARRWRRQQCCCRLKVTLLCTGLPHIRPRRNPEGDSPKCTGVVGHSRS